MITQKSKTKYSKILVTGGAGFIGTNLCTRLLNETASEVICLDNLRTGKEENIEKFFSKKFTFINHDIRKPFDINADLIINLACPASPVAYQKDKVFTAETSSLGIMNVCQNANKYSSHILHASTSEIYGDPLVNPQSENYFGNVNINGIRSCYDEGKRFAETYLIDFANKFEINYKIIRIFNTYGPHMDVDDGRVVSNFINQAIRNENISIYGSGKQTRSICYIDDLVSGILKIMDSKKSNFVTNLGNDNEMSILEIAKIIIDLTGSKSNLTFRDLPQNDPKQRRPDLSYLRSLIDWEKLTDAKDGLKKTIKYFRSIQ